VIDRDSQTWLDIKRWALEEQRRHRIRLETPKVPERDADEARGALQQLQALLDIAKPQAPLSEPAALGDRSGY
jgi:hypothetical protein